MSIWRGLKRISHIFVTASNAQSNIIIFSLFCFDFSVIMRDALLALISFAFVIPSRCYGPQTHNSGTDVNLISYSVDTKDYGFGESLPSESLLISSSSETAVPLPGARYWWQNVDSPFLPNGHPSIISVPSPVPSAAIELNIPVDSDSGTTGLKVPTPAHGITEVVYPDNPFLNGEIEKKTKVFTIAPTIFSTTLATTLGARDYSSPSIEPLSSNSIGKLNILKYSIYSLSLIHI